MLFSTLELSSPPIVLAQPDERYANITASVLEWYDRQTDTKHSATSGSNKVVVVTASREAVNTNF